MLGTVLSSASALTTFHITGAIIITFVKYGGGESENCFPLLRYLRQLFLFMFRNLLPILLIALPLPALAQLDQRLEDQPGPGQSSVKQATPQQINTFMRNFQNGVANGCLRTPPNDVGNPRIYCACYAKSFVARYKPNDLIIINNLAERYPQVALPTISVMMRPESLACTAR